jgi:hypothetical protein
MGFPANNKNCLGKLLSIRVPLPPATIKAVLFMVFVFYFFKINSQNWVYKKDQQLTE